MADIQPFSLPPISDTETQLRTTLGKLEIVLGSILEAIAWTGKDGQIQWCNASFDQLCEKPHLEILGQSFFELLPLFKDGKPVEQKNHLFAQAFDTGVPQSGIYEAGVGERKKMLYLYITRTEPKQGDVTMILVISDITAKWQGQKQIEEKTGFVHLLKTVALRANEARTIEQALEATLKEVCEMTGWPLGHVYFCSEGVIRSSRIWHCKDSSAYAEFKTLTESMTFVKGQGLPGRVLETGKAQWIKDVAQDPNFPRAATAQNAGLHGAFGFPVKTGNEVVAVLEFFSPSPKDPNRGLLEVMTHIGTQLGHVIERQRAQDHLAHALEETRVAHEDLKKAQSQLIQADRLAALGQLAAGVAHEINNPVGFVTSNLSTLEKYLRSLLQYGDALQQVLKTAAPPALPDVEAQVQAAASQYRLKQILEDWQALFSETRSGLERIKKIVSDLKTFSRSDSEEGKSLVSLNVILDSVINIVWNEIKYKAELQKNYSEIPMVFAHGQQLGQVFMNFLVNAAQAIERTPGTITLTTSSADGWVRVDVRDSGVGIPENIRAHIFDPFFTTKPVGQGTGLGLSISYDIIKKHNGRIEVQSEPGRGSCFSVFLPIQSA